MEDIAAYKVRPATEHPVALRFETGTPSFEAQAGLIGTIDYLAWLGCNGLTAPVERRAALHAAMIACADYETDLMRWLMDGLSSIAGLRLYGPQRAEGRVPTFAFTLAGREPATVAAHLGSRGIHAWAGHFYAVEPVRRLASALDGVPGLILQPPAPGTNAFQLWMPGAPVELAERHRSFAHDRKTWSFGAFQPTALAGHSLAEIVIGDASDQYPIDAVPRWIEAFLAYRA